MTTKNRLVSEGVSSGVETRRILGSVVNRQRQTDADEDCENQRLHSLTSGKRPYTSPSDGVAKNLQCITIIRPALAALKHYQTTGKSPDSPDCHSIPVLTPSKKDRGNSGKNLNSIRLNDCNLTDKSCSTLAAVLGSDTNLKELNMNNNKLQDSGVKLLCTGLKNIKCKLEILRLSCCEMTDEGCSDVTSALKSNPSHLRELDLSVNILGDSGVKNLSDLLMNPQFNLEKLHLSDCSITEKQSLILTSALKSNPSHLRELDLSGNKLGNIGVKHLCAVLKDSHCKLERLSPSNVLIVGAAGEEVLLGLHFSLLTVRADASLSGPPVLSVSARLYSQCVIAQSVPRHPSSQFAVFHCTQDQLKEPALLRVHLMGFKGFKMIRVGVTHL
ncbi:ribonuclease inhibitor-like [Pimephales promelas]|nr:ribonuclease inhibitor-like [Pimephales promelas]